MSKVNKAELYRNIARAIDCDPMNFLPEFPARYYVTTTDNGVKFYLRGLGNGVVKYVHEGHLADEILRWVNNRVVGEFSEYQLDCKNSIEAARVWRGMTTPVRNIQSVAWLSDEGLTFQRLPWDPVDAPHPVFDEMMGRTSNSRALMSFIGSLLEGRSDMQQYVWLHGQGQDGKGALSRFLYNVFGQAYSSETVPNTGDRFWTSGLMGKRIVVFPDCNNQTFVTTGLFKSLSGGDPIRVEIKHQPMTTMPMVAKFMFISNEQPAVSSEKADQRRLIYCEMSTIDGDPDPDYQNKLWAEGGAFLNSCMRVYREDCPNFGLIPVDKSDTSLADLTSMNEEEFETAFEHNFALDAGGYVMPVAFQDRLNEIWPKDRRRQNEFRAWMSRKHKIKKQTDNRMAGTPKVYRGINLVFAGQDIRLSQQKQKDLQDGKFKKWTDQGRQPSHLKVVDTQDKDGKDELFLT